MTKLSELAKVLRSKNSGPFELTLDILFDREESYRRVLASGAITRDAVARLYGVPVSHILVLERFDAALGIKITLLRPCASGTVHDRDVYGAQQHVPLSNLQIR